MRCSSSDSQTTKQVSLSDPPIPYELAFVRGDQVDRKFLLSGIVYTAERPQDEGGLLMYAASETADESASTTQLVAPWEERWWHAEVRNSYASTMRFYNGWVPWYGTAPTNWTWWDHASYKGRFDCTSEYDSVLGGTVVSIRMPSERSAVIMPSTQQVYHWDLESAYPATKVDDEPVYFDNLHTWIAGGVKVAIDWTLNTPMQPVAL